jgi:mannose-6-phosphate isomerase-like protein (cupin superfamily)
LERIVLGKLVDEMKRVIAEAELYMDLIVPEDEVRACFELVDTGEAVTIVLKEEPEVVEGSIDPDARLFTTRPVFDNILRGETDIFSLTARAKMTDVRPVNFEIFTVEKTAQIWEVGKAMLTYLFVPGRVKVKSLAPELAGEAHGAHPIPLIYWNGMRSSWIYLKRSEVLNVEGERDPWPQLFVIMKGRGRAIIGGVEFEVEPNRVVYIPMNSVHQVEALTNLELIWLAWMA